MIELPWIAEARKYIGERESPGASNNARIVKLWDLIKTPWFRDDATPWCAAFAGGCLEAVGIKSTRSAAARSYLTYGEPLTYPVYGCIAVKNRYSAGKLVGGHVTFVVAKTPKNDLLCLGGNQGDAVSIVKYPANAFSAFRMPVGLWERQELPLDKGSTQTALKEA